jgi:hypothetical protein
VRRMLDGLADGSPNRAPSRGPPPAASGQSVGPPPARGSEYRGYGSEMENDNPAQATIALEREYARAAALRRFWSARASRMSTPPGATRWSFRPREAAQRLAACRLTQRPGEYYDDDYLEEDSGVGATAELPPGIPAWHPNPFLARTKFFAKGWQKWLLRQDDSSRPDMDGRNVEGDAMSVIILWLDFAMLADKLAKEASKFQEHAIADDLRAESSVYMAAAYEAGRTRADDVTTSLLSRPAAELYSTITRMTLEFTTMRPEGLRYIRTTNTALMNAKSRAIANKAASLPSGTGDDSKSRTGDTVSRRQRMADNGSRPRRRGVLRMQRRRPMRRRRPILPRRPPVKPPEEPMTLRRVEPQSHGWVQVILSKLPPLSIRLGPMKSAARWSEFGCDSRELACLRFGVMDRPDMHLMPSRLSTIRLNAEDSLLMEEVIAERLVGCTWEELTPAQARSAKYVSREFVSRDADGAGRSVGDFSHLSDHYSAVLTKSEMLEGFSVSMRRYDTILSMDLRSRYNHFRLHPAMRDYFVVLVKLMDGTVRYFRYLVLPFGWYRSGNWFSRLVSRFRTTIESRFGYRALTYVDDYLICPSTGRGSTKIACLRTSARLYKLLLRYNSKPQAGRPRDEFRLRALYDAIPPRGIRWGRLYTSTGPALSLPAQGPWHSFPNCDLRPPTGAGTCAFLILRCRTSSP